MHNPIEEPTYTAFAGDQQLVSGDVITLLRAAKAHVEGDPATPLLIFEDGSGRQIDFDLRGTLAQVLARVRPAEAAAPVPTGPGRPKLGVVSREVSLLPRHWDWLAQQPNGSSAALRRLIEQARKDESGEARARAARDAAHRFMWAMAGDLPDFEEVSRALFAGDDARRKRLMKPWPADLRKHVERLLAAGRPTPAG